VNHDKRFLKGWLDKVNGPVSARWTSTCQHGFTTESLASYHRQLATGLPRVQDQDRISSPHPGQKPTMPLGLGQHRLGDRPAALGAVGEHPVDLAGIGHQARASPPRPGARARDQEVGQRRLEALAEALAAEGLQHLGLGLGRPGPRRCPPDLSASGRPSRPSGVCAQRLGVGAGFADLGRRWRPHRR